MDKEQITQRDAVWTLHHMGYSVSQIAERTGRTQKFVRREILLRWAYDDTAPEGVKDGRVKHDRE